MKNQRSGLPKEERAVLEDAIRRSYFHTIDDLDHEDVLEIFGFTADTGPLATTDENAKVVINNKSARMLSPILGFLNEIVDGHFDVEEDGIMRHYLLGLVSFAGRVHTEEAYQGLTKFLNRLLTYNLNLKDVFLAETVFSLAEVSVGLGREDSVSILKSAISHLPDPDRDLSELVEYFDKLNGPEGIKEILIHPATGRVPEVEDRCLALLQKHDPDFVKDWKTQKASANISHDRI